MRRQFAAVCLATILLSCGNGPEVTPIDEDPNKGAKDYSRALPLGARALRKLDPLEWPDLSGAIGSADASFAEAAQRSQTWFTAPSSKTHYPILGITHDQARASVFAMHTMLAEGGDPATVATKIKLEFDCYMSIGCDDEGTVLFTGYFSPVFKASKTRQGPYQHALYKPPKGLNYDSSTGKPAAPYHTRRVLETEEGALLPRDEIVYLPSKLDAYLIHVNGSAKLELEEGGVVYVGYAANNGHDYVSIRAEMVADKVIGPHDGLPAMREHFRANPDSVDMYLARNPRFIFFQFYDGGDWPSGSLGFPVTGKRSLATDKKIFPRGGVVMADTKIPSGPFTQFMLDQDTGGAIRAPGRADIFMGIGGEAESEAGGTASEGKLFYFFLKPGRISVWLAKMGR